MCLGGFLAFLSGLQKLVTVMAQNLVFKQNNNDDQSALCTTSSPSFTPKEEMSFLTFLLFCSVTINHNKLRHTLYFILLTFVCTPFFLEHYYICMNTTTTITSYLHYAHGFFLFPSMNCLGTPGVRNV